MTIKKKKLNKESPNILQKDPLNIVHTTTTDPVTNELKTTTQVDSTTNTVVKENIVTTNNETDNNVSKRGRVKRAQNFIDSALEDMVAHNLSDDDIFISEELLKDDLDVIDKNDLTTEELKIARDILQEKLKGKIPSKFKRRGVEKPQVIYVFQGGGALGSYQIGAYEALSEHGYAPDMIVGISIGAINAAIIAGNRPENRMDRLCQFWDIITTRIPFPAINQFGMIKIHHWLSAQSSLILGQKGFFTRRPISPALVSNSTPDKISYYDTTPLRNTLLKLVDFKYLNEKHVRLCVGAVNLKSGKFKFFDNFEQEITVDHIMASSALPPGFPAIKIANDYYVDGGVYSNTPISKVIDEFAESENEMKNVLCFMIDLFSLKNDTVPHSLDGILERIKDIRFSSHTTRSTNLHSTAQNLSHAIHFLSTKLSKEQLEDPQIQEIIKLGFANRMSIVHLVYKSPKGTELESKDYEFSVETANKHRIMGYTGTKQMLLEEEENWMNMQNTGVTIYDQGDNHAFHHKLL